jgi:adenosylcobalamin-dependent ribonucleoside-triphosphate reductase
MEYPIETPWSTIGYLTYKRTYARKVGERTEEWEETVDRVLNACRHQLKVGFDGHEEERLRRYMLQLKGTVAGRFLWQLGTETVERLGLPSLQNCAFVVVDNPIRPFTWAFDMLMLGSGVGYNIQREYVYKLPPVREDFVRLVRKDDASASFIVPDTREGWVQLLERMLHSAFYEQLHDVTYSCQLVRGKGAPIKGFGGVASGPEDLVRGIEQIGGVLESRRGKQLRPIDCLDIMNIIGSVVVAGNVRRSAQLAIGDSDDIQYLKAKNWSEGNIPNWRAMSNNSVVCNDIKQLPEEFWKTYEGGSEPYGLINLKLSQSCGRIGDTRYKDKGVRGFNP